MIDQRIVGAIVRGDLKGYRLGANDARFIIEQRIATPLFRLLLAQPDAADQQATQLLARVARQATKWSMLQVATANKVAAMLGDAGIRVLVYKGVAFAASRLGTWQGRESLDVDVIIDVKDVEYAHAVMLDNGMVRWDGKNDTPTALFRFHDIELAYSGLPATVDVHWRLETPGYLDIPFAELWEGRRRLTVDSLDVWTLGAAETMLVSAVHGSREHWQTLRQMLDVGLQLAHMPPDEWRTVTTRAHSSGASKSLAVALAVAQSCEVPGLPAFAGDWARAVAEDLLSSWSAGIQPVTAASPINALQRRWLRWQMAGSPTAAFDSLVRASLRQVFHQRSWDLVPSDSPIRKPAEKPWAPGS